MIAKVYSAVPSGMHMHMVTVEVEVARGGFPTFKIIGLPHKSISEARDRVRSAIRNAGFTFPRSRVTVNLAPVDLPKRGGHCDLAIAVGILAAHGDIPLAVLEKALFMGELSLDGHVLPVSGLSAALSTNLGIEYQIVYCNNEKLLHTKNVTVLQTPSLQKLVSHMRDQTKLSMADAVTRSFIESEGESDFDSILGQQKAKRALEIAAVGQHSLLLRGFPGVGKTLMARALATLLPLPTIDEQIKIQSIQSLLESPVALVNGRPFVQSQPSISVKGLIGGGSPPIFGDLTKATGGILFLDELPEFSRNCIEALRQPLDDGCVRFSHIQGSVTFPIASILVVAANPCPCGYLGHPTHLCTCSQQSITRYANKLSGPFLDRIDLSVNVDEDSRGKSESFQKIKSRIEVASRVHRKRIAALKKIHHANIYEYSQLTKAADIALRSHMYEQSFSMRRYHSLMKVSRTIADIAGQEKVTEEHIEEAISFF